MLYTLRFSSLQDAVCFTMPTCLVPVLIIFYRQGVLKLKKNNNNNSGAKGLILQLRESFQVLFPIILRIPVIRFWQCFNKCYLHSFLFYITVFFDR